MATQPQLCLSVPEHCKPSQNPKPCRYGPECNRIDCQFNHDLTEHRNTSRKPKPCWNGLKCKYPDCKFRHPQPASTRDSIPPPVPPRVPPPVPPRDPPSRASIPPPIPPRYFTLFVFYDIYSGSKPLAMGNPAFADALAAYQDEHAIGCMEDTLTRNLQAITASLNTLLDSAERFHSSQ